MTATADAVRRALETMLPADVRGAVAVCGELPGALLSEEAAQAAGYGKKRLQEFTAGRLLARRLMRDAGLAEAPLLSGDRREPLWPEGVSGSISHSQGIVVVILAPGASGGVGIDLECRDELDERLFTRIFAEDEIARLPTVAGGQAALGMFAAKEAFYKAQFAVSRRFLGFEGLTLDLADSQGLHTHTLHDPLLRDLLRGHTVEIRSLVGAGFALAFSRISACD